MVNKAKKVMEMFDNAQCTIYVRKEDLALKDELMKLYKNISVVKESQDILIGGLFGENPQSLLVVDETLDFALKNQKEWFSKNSGLIIK